jgi:hypothetical protein
MFANFELARTIYDASLLKFTRRQVSLPSCLIVLHSIVD